MTAPKTAVGDLGMRVAEEIRVALVRRRISATTLAQRIGVTQSYLARRMSGAQPLDLDDVERIAAALDLSVVDLLPEPMLRVWANKRSGADTPKRDPLAARVVTVGGSTVPRLAPRRARGIRAVRAQPRRRPAARPARRPTRV